MKNFKDFPALNALRALDNSPTMRAIRALEDSPTIRAIRQLEDSPMMRAIRELEDSPMMRAMRELEKSPAQKVLQQLEKSSAMEAIRRLENSPALRAVRGLESSSVMQALSNAIDKLSYGYGPIMLGEAYKEVLRRHEIASASGMADTFDTIVNEVQEKANHAPSGPLSTEFYLNFIFAIILYYLSQMSGADSEEHIINRINTLETTITQQIKKLQNSEGNGRLYVVKRPLKLRSGPSTENKVLEVLPENLKVIERDRQSSWKKIEYFDYVENRQKSGWVYNRYLIALIQEDLPLEIKVPNAITRAAMQEAHAMKKAKFNSAQELFDDLEKVGKAKTRKVAAK